jgi:hypothetical protein
VSIAFVVGAGGAGAVTSEGEREEGAKAHNSETHKKFHRARKKRAKMFIQDNTKISSRIVENVGLEDVLDFFLKDFQNPVINFMMQQRIKDCS